MAFFQIVLNNLFVVSLLLAVSGLISGLLLSKYQYIGCKRFAYCFMAIGILLCVATQLPMTAGYIIFAALNLPMTGIVLALLGLIAGLVLSKCQYMLGRRIAYVVMTVGIVLFFLNAIPRTGGSPMLYQFTADGVATITDVRYSLEKKQLTLKLDIMPKYPRQFIYRMYYEKTLPSERLIQKIWLSIRPLQSVINNYYSDLYTRQQLLCPMSLASADAFVKRRGLKKNIRIPVILAAGGCGGCLRTIDIVSTICPGQHRLQ